MTSACRQCGVKVTRDDYASSWMRRGVWYDADRVDLDFPALMCEAGDYEGEEHEPTLDDAGVVAPWVEP